MKIKDFKIGDTIRILKQPTLWSSHFSRNNPLDTVKYPFECVIENIKYADTHADMLAGGYGWSLDKIIEAGVEIISKEINYEIY